VCLYRRLGKEGDEAVWSSCLRHWHCPARKQQAGNGSERQNDMASIKCTPLHEQTVNSTSCYKRCIAHHLARLACLPVGHRVQ
jgi:hypothetical protein